MNVGMLATYRSPVVADPDWVAAFARAVEDEGGDSVWAVEHVVVPGDYASRYPYAESGRMPLGASTAIPDPLEWLAFVAACTTRVRLGTAMLILPEHHPVELAKRLATLDVVSRGRVVAGVGVGWLREEAEALGVDFSRRGAMADEYLQVLRVLWREELASFEGAFVRFRGMSSMPKPVQPGGVPVVVGGHSDAAARRAGRLGDGFFPLGVRGDELVRLVGVARDAAGGRDLEVSVNAPRDPADLAFLRDLGVSRIVLSAPADGGLDEVRRRVGEWVARATEF